MEREKNAIASATMNTEKTKGQEDYFPAKYDLRPWMEGNREKTRLNLPRYNGYESVSEWMVLNGVRIIFNNDKVYLKAYMDDHKYGQRITDESGDRPLVCSITILNLEMKSRRSSDKGYFERFEGYIHPKEDVRIQDPEGSLIERAPGYPSQKPDEIKEEEVQTIRYVPSDYVDSEKVKGEKIEVRISGPEG